LRQPKIREVRDIRKLNNILSKPLPLAILLDPERALEDAVEAAKAEAVEGFPGELEHAIAQTIRLLKQPGIDSWLNPTERARELWDLLVDTIDRIRPLMDRGE
jgi:hypothetical protein